MSERFTIGTVDVPRDWVVKALAEMPAGDRCALDNDEWCRRRRAIGLPPPPADVRPQAERIHTERIRDAIDAEIRRLRKCYSPILNVFGLSRLDGMIESLQTIRRQSFGAEFPPERPVRVEYHCAVTGLTDLGGRPRHKRISLRWTREVQHQVLDGIALPLGVISHPHQFSIDVQFGEAEVPKLGDTIKVLRNTVMLDTCCAMKPSPLEGQISTVFEAHGDVPWGGK